MVFFGVNYLLPLLGYFLKGSYLPLILIVFFLKKLTFGGIITFGIPTFFATLAIYIINKKNITNNIKYKIYDFLLRVILPLIAIILFVIHPVGRQAYLYSFYWFIPVILFFVEKISLKSFIFSNNLSATFIAHSIGSLVWLYTVKMTVIQWMVLIPVVAIERFVFAIGMTFGYLILKKVLELKKSYILKF